jgi:hypothetical protein
MFPPFAAFVFRNNDPIGARSPHGFGIALLARASNDSELRIQGLGGDCDVQIVRIVIDDHTNATGALDARASQHAMALGVALDHDHVFFQDLAVQTLVSLDQNEGDFGADFISIRPQSKKVDFALPLVPADGRTLAPVLATPYNARMSYVPQPIATSHIELSPEIRQLTEELAKNTHELWAQERIAQGWRFGPERSDQRKEHPSLVPYEQLPEAEKVYDRNTAMGTLKAMQALGYRIVKGGED